MPFDRVANIGKNIAPSGSPPRTPERKTPASMHTPDTITRSPELQKSPTLSQYCSPTSVPVSSRIHGTPLFSPKSVSRVDKRVDDGFELKDLWVALYKALLANELTTENMSAITQDFLEKSKEFESDVSLEDRVKSPIGKETNEVCKEVWDIDQRINKLHVDFKTLIARESIPGERSLQVFAAEEAVFLIGISDPENTNLGVQIVNGIEKMCHTIIQTVQEIAGVLYILENINSHEAEQMKEKFNLIVGNYALKAQMVLAKLGARDGKRDIIRKICDDRNLRQGCFQFTEDAKGNIVTLPVAIAPIRPLDEINFSGDMLRAAGRMIDRMVGSDNVEHLTRQLNSMSGNSGNNVEGARSNLIIEDYIRRQRKEYEKDYRELLGEINREVQVSSSEDKFEDSKESPRLEPRTLFKAKEEPSTADGSTIEDPSSLGFEDTAPNEQEDDEVPNLVPPQIPKSQHPSPRVPSHASPSPKPSRSPSRVDESEPPMPSNAEEKLDIQIVPDGLPILNSGDEKIICSQVPELMSYQYEDTEINACMDILWQHIRVQRLDNKIQLFPLFATGKKEDMPEFEFTPGKYHIGILQVAGSHYIAYEISPVKDSKGNLLVTVIDPNMPQNETFANQRYVMIVTPLSYAFSSRVMVRILNTYQQLHGVGQVHCGALAVQSLFDIVNERVRRNNSGYLDTNGSGLTINYPELLDRLHDEGSAKTELLELQIMVRLRQAKHLLGVREVDVFQQQTNSFIKIRDYNFARRITEAKRGIVLQIESDKKEAILATMTALDGIHLMTNNRLKTLDYVSLQSYLEANLTEELIRADLAQNGRSRQTLLDKVKANPPQSDSSEDPEINLLNMQINHEYINLVGYLQKKYPKVSSR